MASSKGGLRFVEASKAPSGVDASTTSEFEAAVEVEAAVEAKQATDRFGNPRIRTEKVDNVMGSQAGAGSGDFHMYRHHRRTEMLRVERMEGQAAVDEAEESHARRVEHKRKECEERTARNAEKRRKKKEAKAKRDAIAKGTGQAPSEVAFKDDGSFLERARAQIEAQKAKEAEAPPKPA